MESIDSPKYKGESLLASWRQADPLLGLPKGNWHNADVRGRQFKGFRAIYRNLQHLAAPDCDMPDAILAHCNLSHSDFQRSILRHSSWISCHLEQAKMNSARLSYGRFDHAHLRSTSFQRCHLQHASFRLANLHHANFEHADMRWCDLRGANLRQARWNGASRLGCIINHQTKEHSQWRDEEIDSWIDAGAYWSDEAVQATRFSPGVDLYSTQPSTFDVGDALSILCKDIGNIAVAGHPPHLFIATLDCSPHQIRRLLQEVATTTNPTNPSLIKKWTPVHNWLRNGASISTWVNQDGVVHFDESIRF